MAKRREPSQEPWVSNYPLLKAWLERHNAQCVWQTMMGKDYPYTCAIEQWRVGTGLVLLVVHCDQRGWELYTAPNTLSIDETLKDAERRCGLLT